MRESTSNLPFATSLNGSCSNICPVKINIHEQIYARRRVLVEWREVPLAKKSGDEGGQPMSFPVNRHDVGDVEVGGLIGIK